MQRLPHQHHKNHKPSGVSLRCQHPRMALDICGGSGDPAGNPAGLPAACSLPFAYISSFSIIFSLSPLTPSYFLFLFPLLSTFMSTFSLVARGYLIRAALSVSLSRCFQSLSLYTFLFLLPVAFAFRCHFLFPVPCPVPLRSLLARLLAVQHGNGLHVYVGCP